MPTWDDVVRIATTLPEVEVSTSYRTPALKVAGKLIVRLRDDDGGLVVMCELDEKEALLASGDPAYYTTPHYDGYGSILVHLDQADPAELAELIDAAWWLKAPAKVRKARERGDGSPR